MFRLKKLLNLSPQGWQNFKKAVFAAVLSNISLLLSFMVVIQAIVLLVQPLMSSSPIDTLKLWVCFAGGVFAAALYFFAYKNEYRKTYATAYAESEKIRIEIAEHLRKLPLSFFNKKDLSELTANMMGDCTSVEHTMSHVAPGLCANIITVVVTSFMLAFYDWRMALCLFAPLPLAALFVLGSKKLQSLFGERHVLARIDVSRQVQEYLEGIKVVKAFGLSGEKSRALEAALKNMMRQSIIFEAVTGTFVMMGMMILQVGIGLTVLVGIQLFINGGLALIPFLTFLVISARIYAPLLAIFTLLPELFYLFISTARMQTLRCEKIMDGDENTVLSGCGIEMRNVTFAYNEENVINNLSLSIPANSVTALVGPSGSGKSTVSRLIARFWDVSGGAILIGGRDVKTVDPEHLMTYMSFVFQDVVLFNDTVINNIRVGRHGATDDEVLRAAAMARCDEFIRAMPAGYDTVIGENGCTLSGGERQRISIARAFLKNAPIVMLDEATASLDAENEVLIQAAISELVKERTVIIIAHRLRTVMGADKIVVLDEGKVAEEGRGEELLSAGGLFSRMYRTQQQSLGWSVNAS